MQLELASFFVEEVEFASATTLEGRRLRLDKAGLCDLLAEDRNFAGVQVEIARPGEDVRIVHVLDTIEPRTKIQGRGSIYPGLLGPPITAGSGRTHRLSGVAVMVSSEFPEPVSGLLVPREAIVDMAGPAAPLCPFSRTINIVLALKGAAGVSNVEYDHSLRMAAAKAARYFAETTRELTAGEVKVFENSSAGTLPKVVYIDQVQSQGLFAQTFLYGKAVNDLVPTVVHPNELQDGALVSGNYVYGCAKNPTYLHTNNPVAEELWLRHGKEIDFAAIVLSKGHNYTHPWKERSAEYAAKLAKLLGAEGVVVTQEGGGNAAVDTMLTVRACEQMGMKTVLLMIEQGGPDGTDAALVYSVKEAEAIVSIGSQEKVVTLPPVQRVVGGESMTDQKLDALRGGQVTIEAIYCGTNQLGAGTLAAAAF